MRRVTLLLALAAVPALAACLQGLSLPEKPGAGTPPSVESFSPDRAFSGETVTVTGRALGTFAAGTFVRFGGSRPTNPLQVAPDGTSLLATVPADASDGAIEVSTAAGAGESTTRFTWLGAGHLAWRQPVAQARLSAVPAGAWRLGGRFFAHAGRYLWTRRDEPGAPLLEVREEAYSRHYEPLHADLLTPLADGCFAAYVAAPTQLNGDSRSGSIAQLCPTGSEDGISVRRWQDLGTRGGSFTVQAVDADGGRVLLTVPNTPSSEGWILDYQRSPVTVELPANVIAATAAQPGRFLLLSADGALATLDATASPPAQQALALEARARAGLSLRAGPRLAVAGGARVELLDATAWPPALESALVPPFAVTDCALSADGDHLACLDRAERQAFLAARRAGAWQITDIPDVPAIAVSASERGFVFAQEGGLVELETDTGRRLASVPLSSALGPPLPLPDGATEGGPREARTLAFVDSLHRVLYRDAATLAQAKPPEPQYDRLRAMTAAGGKLYGVTTERLSQRGSTWGVDLAARLSDGAPDQLHPVLGGRAVLVVAPAPDGPAGPRSRLFLAGLAEPFTRGRLSEDYVLEGASASVRVANVSDDVLVVSGTRGVLALDAARAFATPAAQPVNPMRYQWIRALVHARGRAAVLMYEERGTGPQAPVLRPVDLATSEPGPAGPGPVDDWRLALDAAASPDGTELTWLARDAAGGPARLETVALDLATWGTGARRSSAILPSGRRLFFSSGGGRLLVSDADDLVLVE